jgi:hypothetical protein
MATNRKGEHDVYCGYSRSDYAHFPSRSGDEKAARMQAATMLYHYVKAVCLYATVVGPKTAFFSHYLLEDGRVAAQVSGYELAEMTPRLLLSGKD